MVEPLPKGFDALLESAFKAGVAFGRETFPGVPAGGEYERWRQQWAGLPHEDQSRPLPPPGEPIPPGHYDVSYGEAVRRGLVRGEALPEPSGIDHGASDRDVTGGW